MTHCFDEDIGGEQNKQKRYSDSARLHQLLLYKGLQTTCTS